MESLLNRYRNITVLLLVICAQLVLLAVQVKNDQDVQLIRVWAVTAVTPAARVAEWFRGGSVGFIRNYITLHDTNDENRRLKEEVGRLRLENNFLKNELSTADRAKALQIFQAHTPSKMIAASVIGNGAGSNSKVVFVSRGSAEGVMRGMAVVTPDGIVGKVIAAYPTASEVLLITDATFAAGVISQKGAVRGTLKGQGTPLCKVDYVPSEDKVEEGEWFYTSGDDRVFPRGFPVGSAKAVHPGQPFKEILVEPSGLQHGLEEVLILVEGVHQAIPDTPPTNQPVYIAPAPPATPNAQPAEAQAGAAPPQSGTGTEADKLRNAYKSVGETQNYSYGDSGVGARAPDFTKLPTTPGAQVPAATPPAAPGGRPVTPAGGPAAGQAVPAPGPARPPGVPAGQTVSPTQSKASGPTGPAVGPPKPTTPPARQTAPATGTPKQPPPPTGQTAPATGAPRPSGPAAGQTAPPTGPPKSPPKPGDPIRRNNQAAGAPGGPGQ
jgi:rod shape-determining protein MreC